MAKRRRLSMRKIKDVVENLLFPITHKPIASYILPFQAVAQMEIPLSGH
jgi:hypothetical protein